MATIQLTRNVPATIIDADLVTNPTSTTHGVSVKAVNDLAAKIAGERLPALGDSNYAFIADTATPLALGVDKLNQYITVRFSGDYTTITNKTRNLLLPQLSASDGVKIVRITLDHVSDEIDPTLKLVVGYNTQGGTTLQTPLATLSVYDEVTFISYTTTAGSAFTRWSIFSANIKTPINAAYLLSQIDTTTSQANGIVVSVVNNKLVFNLVNGSGSGSGTSNPSISNFTVTPG